MICTAFILLSETNLMNTQKGNLLKGWENIEQFIFNSLKWFVFIVKIVYTYKEILMDWEKISANDEFNKGLISKIHEESC